MRLLFSFCKILSFCLFVFYIFPSCKSIRIVGSDTTNDTLKMIDEKGDPAENYEAWPGQKIKWKIKDKAVKSFDSMPRKKMQLHSIFRQEPHKKFLSKTWKAKIEKTYKDEEKYYYNIIWKDNAGTSHTFDPLIQVKPRRN